MIALALIFIETFIVPGRKYAFIILYFHGGDDTSSSRMPYADAPGPLTMPADGTQVTTGIDDGIVDTSFPEQVYRLVDSVALGKGAYIELHGGVIAVQRVAVEDQVTHTRLKL